MDVATIQSDRFSIEMIVGNLLDNAVKYREQDRPLRIEVRTRAIADDRIEIEIADNGRGIAERDQARVFDLFKRSGTPDRPGDGIGLAYVLAVLHNLGGNISLKSELGRGTSFRLTMPRASKPRRISEIMKCGDQHAIVDLVVDHHGLPTLLGQVDKEA